MNFQITIRNGYCFVKINDELELYKILAVNRWYAYKARSWYSSLEEALSTLSRDNKRTVIWNLDQIPTGTE